MDCGAWANVLAIRSIRPAISRVDFFIVLILRWLYLINEKEKTMAFITKTKMIFHNAVDMRSINN
jgi:hypothetical protein